MDTLYHLLVSFFVSTTGILFYEHVVYFFIDKRKQAIADGFTAFITGMAPGVDTWAALEVLSLQEQHPAVQLVCAVPFEGVEKNRTDEEIAAFRNILQKAAHIEYVCKKRGRWNSIARDRWMVDHARRVIAVFNGTPGGTEYTLGYAQRKGREIRMVREG